MKTFELQDGRKFLYQWDQNLTLKVNDPNIEYVEFYHSKIEGIYSESVVTEAENKFVKIPNELLVQDGQLRVYGRVGDREYDEDSDGKEYTKTAFFFDIIAKPKPENFDISTGAWMNLYQKMHDLEIKVENQDGVPDFLSFKLNTENNSYTCLGFNKDSDISAITEIVIPEIIEGLPVTTIGKNAFANNKTLKKVYIPNTISSIEKGAFAGCTELINYINNVGYIGKWAVALNSAINGKLEFEAGTIGIIDELCFHKDGIDEVIIPESTLYIGTRAFESAYPMNKVTIKNKNVVIGYYAFADLLVQHADIPAHAVAYFRTWKLKTLKVNSGISIAGGISVAGGEFPEGSLLEEIEFPETLQFIGASAFGHCNAINKVTIPNIEAWCNITFENPTSNPLYCMVSDGEFIIGETGTALTNLVVPKTVKEIKDNAFCGYQKLVMAEFEDNSVCARIGAYAFHFCESLESITLPSTITEIGAQAFFNTAITSITIPDDVQIIGDEAFSGCARVTDIVMGKSIRKIGRKAFSGIEVSNFYLRSVKSWCSVELGDAFASPLLKSKNDSTLYAVDCNGNTTKLETLIIPNTVKEIKAYTFQGTLTIKELVVPESVDTIEDSAFCYNGNISAVYLPKSLKLIEAYAFDYCGGIKTICYAGSSTDWSKIAIREYNDALNNVAKTWNKSYIKPSDITKVSQLKNDAGYITADDVPTKISVFENDVGYAKKEEIPCMPTEGLVYQLNSDNQSYACLGIPSSDKKHYAKVIIPKEVNGYPVTELRSASEAGFINVSELVLPQGLIEIADGTFAFNQNITSINIPESVTIIAGYAFIDCFNLDIYCEAKQRPDGWDKDWIYNMNPSSTGRYTRVFLNQKPATQAYVDNAIDNIDLSNYITEDELISKDYVTRREVEPISTKELDYQFNDYTQTYKCIGIIGGSAKYFDKAIVADRINGYLVTSVGTVSGSDFRDIGELVLPETITSIGTFDGYSMRSVKIPSSVTHIKSYAFIGCSGLKTVYIPESVTSIDRYAFGCGKDTVIYCEAESKPKGWDEEWNRGESGIVAQVVWNQKSATQAYVNKANERILEVAEGKNKSFVCDTIQDMVEKFGATTTDTTSYTFILPENFTETIKTGDVILIKDIQVPDYWIETTNGTEGSLHILETTKVDLSEYETIEHAEETYATKTAIPKKVSDLENDENFVSKSYVDDVVSGLTNIDVGGLITRTELDERDYATKSEIPTVPSKVSELENDADFVSQEYVDAQNANTLAVAEGKNKSFVCDDIANMVQIFGATAAANNSYTFTLPSAFPESIKTGDVILIKQIDVPDYWIATDDGIKGTLYILETTKVDLTKYETTQHASSTYATKTEVNQKSSATNILNGTLDDGTVAKNAIRTATGKALHDNATVFGYNNISPNDSVLMSGNYATEAPVDTWDGNKIFLAVGNGYWQKYDDGTSELIRRNAFEVRKCGDALVHRDFYIGGKIKIGNTVITEAQLKQLLQLLG